MPVSVPVTKSPWPITICSLHVVEDHQERVAVVDIVYIVEPKDTSKQLDTGSFLVSYEQISQSTSEIFNAWFEPSKADYLHLMLKLLWAVKFRPASPQVEILMLTQALESYHRRKYGGHYMKEEDYQPYREQIVRSISLEMLLTICSRYGW